MTGPLPWVLSARDEPALRAHAAELWAHVEARPRLDPADVGWSLVAGRDHLPRRAVVVGDGREALLAGLEAVASGAPAPGVARGTAGPAGRLAFVFPGQGSQWPGMALDLAAASPGFAATLRACEAALGPHVDWRLDDVLGAAPDDPVWERSDVVQPSLFCVMVSLAALWRGFGVRPDAVVGHSLGEISAACVAGILSLEDAARVAALTSRALHELGGDDGMVLVDLGAAQLERRIAQIDGRLTLAAFNGPHAIVVSGEQPALEQLLAGCDADGIRARRIRVDGTSSVAHSSQIEAIRERLARDLAPVSPRPSGVAFYSAVSGGPADYDELGPDYWYRSLRRPVRFQQATSALVRDGATAFVESSPHPVLTFAVEGTIEAAGRLLPVIGSLRRDGGMARVLESLGEAHAGGIAVDWAAAFAGMRPQRVELPRPEAVAGAAVAAGVEEMQAAAPADSLLAAEDRDDGALLALVREHAAAVLGLDSPDAVAPRRAFRELGMESLQGVELRNRLAQVTGLRLPSTLVYDHPTPAAVAERLGAILSGARTASRATVRAQSHHDEPIAIVGIGCRYPGGVESADELWELVASGTDAIGPFPTDRGWDLERLYDPDPDTPGTSYVQAGGFVYDAPEFDAAFFQIAPREAAAMDPQQRLALETAWAALEDAAIDPGRLAGTMTGVFLGVSSQDYGSFLPGAATDYEGLRMTGSLTSVVSGRVSYSLGLQGPGVTVDTACSSSLVALHLACQALRSGECSLALAGGVTVLSSPGMWIEFSRQRGLAADGRSKAFAAAADGASWAEGAGVLVVERLSDARRNGHRVLGLVRGTATNQDGASNGLSAPNGPSQEQVIRQALANAGLRPVDVDAVEAHGTGTTLGDPIEAQALLATYGQGRDGAPLWLGSIKSNIGHSHAAAGVAGAIKMLMAMRAGVLPRTLHVDAPTPHVDWSAGEIELLTDERPWARGERPRRAGVSGFGISGTNAHVVLEEAPGPEGAEDAVLQPRAVPWVLSAKTGAALRARAQRLHAHLRAHPQLAPLDVGWTLATGRARLAHRAAIAGADRAELLAGLQAVASALPADRVATGLARDGAKVAFVFPGQGSQWLGMALDLWDSTDVFAAHMQACADALAPHTGWDLRAVIAGSPGAPALERMDVVQPASFAVFVSLAALWRSYGVHPSVVVGHSQGEIAAAHVAGALSLEDAARVVALRSAALVELAGAGGMLSVHLPAGDVLARVERFGGRVSLASYNSPRSVVLSGEPRALRELLDDCEASGARARMIAVDYASHSAQIESIRARLLEDLRPIAPQPAAVPFMSTLTATIADGARLGAEHWYRNLREPVRFEQATRALVEEGVTAFVECSPHPVLTWAVNETVDDAAAQPDRLAVIGSLRRGEGTLARFLASAGEAFAHGVEVDWERAFAGSGARRVGLPSYPFERTRFWLEAGAGAGDGERSLSAAGVGAAQHPLLGASIELAGRDGCLLTGRVSLSTHPWLADHELFGEATLPQAALAEMALRAGAEAGCDTVEELTLAAPLVLPAAGGVQLQVTVGGEDDRGLRPLELHARADGEDAWVLHASGALRAAGDIAAGPPAAQWPPPGAVALDVEELYDRLAVDGRSYGPEFQALRAWRLGDELFTEAALAEEHAADGARFAVHPALLDAALHPAIAQRDRAGAPLALQWRGLRVQQPGAVALRARIAPVPGEDAVTLTATDERGAPALRAGAIALRPLPAPAAGAPAAGALEALYRVRWTPLPAVPAPNGPPPRVVALGVAELAGAERCADPAAFAASVPPPGTVAVAAPRDARAALELVQAWLAEVQAADARLAVLVPGAAAILDGEAADPDAAAVRGLLRSVQSEHPGRFVTIDAADPAAIAAAVATHEPEVAVRDGAILVPRLARAPDDPPPAATWRLAPERAGALVGAAPDQGDGDRPLRPGEVRLAVRAAGVGLRDVRVAIGVQSGPLGTAAAGVVLAAGEGVAQPAVGDRVMGTVAGAFGPLAVADAAQLVPIPAGWSFAQAAAAASAGGDEPPPFVAFDVRAGSEALRRAGGAQEDGTVVLTVPHAPDADGTVLVTGGTGGVGAVVAEHLARRHGIRRLLLVSRRGPAAPGAGELRERLAPLGCEATIAACDVADRAALAALLEAIDPAHPLTGVVHAAGALDNGMVESLDAARLDGVMRPKAVAARWLHELTRAEDLAFFVLFSSVAATFNHPGQGNYAAANAYLDGLAQRRRAEGLPATAVAWGLWGTGSGMATRLSREDIEVLAADTGQRELAVQQALALLDVAIGHRAPLLVATTLDLPALRAQARAGVLPALLSDLVRAPARARRAAGDGEAGGSLAQQLAALAPGERDAVVLELVRAQAAAVLGHASPADVAPDRTFKEMGFDSLGSVVLRNRLGQISGLRLPSTLVFDHPTPAAMASFVRGLAEQEDAQAPPAPPGPIAQPPAAALPARPPLAAPAPAATNGAAPHAPPPVVAGDGRGDLDGGDRRYRGAVLATAAAAARSLRLRAWILASQARLARLSCRLVVEVDGTPRFDDLPRIVTDAVGEGGGSLTIRIGRDCRFGRELTLDVWTHADSVLEFGDRCQFQDRIRLQPWGGAIRFGSQVRVRDGAELKSKGELTIGADSFIGRNATVHCHERVALADHVNLAEGVNVMDSDHTHDGSDTYVARQRIVSAPVIVESNVFVGTNALILRGSRVGRNAMIATGSVLTGGDYPERHLLAGVPAQPLRPLAPEEPIPS